MAIAQLAALPIGFALVGGPMDWDNSTLFFALCWISMVSALGALHTRALNFFDSTDACTLTGLAILGPLPAFAMMVFYELVQWSHERFRALAALSNGASSGLGIIAGAALLNMTGTDFNGGQGSASDYVCLFLAGYLMVVVQYVSSAAPLTIHDGGRVRSLIVQELLRTLPIQLPPLVLGVVATYCFSAYGAWIAVGVLVVNAVMWQLAAPPLLKRWMLSGNEGPTLAMRARAIADVLDLDRDHRRALNTACNTKDVGVPQLSRLSDFEEVMNILVHAGQRWDSAGPVPGASREAPVEAQVLAVARAWQEQSDRGLSDRDAVQYLTVRSGSEFDPRVVAAMSTATTAAVPVTPRMRLFEPPNARATVGRG